MPHSLPPYAADPGEEEVVRVVTASMATTIDSVYKSMERIRRGAMKFNAPLGVHAMLLYQSGWFVYWVEGPANSVQTLLETVRNDKRHHSQRVLHQSRGKRCLPTEWSMMMSPSTEPSLDFGRRVLAVRYQMERGIQYAPTSVLRRLASPIMLPQAQQLADPEAFYRVCACGSATEAFGLVHWLANEHGVEKTHRRVAGANDLDSGTDYVEFMQDGHPCRVIATSRQGLLHGLTRAFLPDFSLLILLLNGHAVRDDVLMNRVAESLRGLPNTPDLLGVAPDPETHIRMTRRARAEGLTYIASGPIQSTDGAAIWHAAAQQLQRLVPPPGSIWPLPEPRLTG